MPNSDNHNHIIYDSLPSMIDSPGAKAFDALSVTEHISQFITPRTSVKFHSVHRKGRMFLDFEEYLREFEVVNGRVERPRVNRGLEVDYISDYFQDIANFVNQQNWDLILVSVHELKNGEDIENKLLPQDRESSVQRWREYINLQKNALESDGIPFDVLTHPVRIARSSHKTPEEIDELLIELGQLARKENKALELNGNDISRDYPLVEKLARACSEANCEVSFGSDAHHPNEVGRGYERANELIKRFNLKTKFHQE